MEEYKVMLTQYYQQAMHLLQQTAQLSPDGRYNVSILASYFHSIPHIDTKLMRSNGTFDPEDTSYLESLGILIALPGFWLILTLLFFLVFFLCRCCDVNSSSGKPQKAPRLACCKCMLVLIGLVAMAVLCVGMFANVLAHRGVVGVQQASQRFVGDLDQLRNLTSSLHSELEHRMFGNIRRLQDKLIHPLVRNREALENLHSLLEHMKNNLTKSIEQVFHIQAQLRFLQKQDYSGNDNLYPSPYSGNYDNFIQLPRWINLIEEIRWPATWAIYEALFACCILLMCGVCKHSRCLLIVFSVFGLLSLVVCYVLASQNLGVSVAGSDFCMRPRPFLHKELSKLMNNSIADHYLDCTGHSTPSFTLYTARIRTALNGLSPDIKQLSYICEKYCPEHEVTSMIRNIGTAKFAALEQLQQVDVLSNCEELHFDYIETMNFACKDMLEGFAVMLATSGATGLLFTLLVLCASHTWINIRNKHKYQSVDGGSCGGSAGDTLGEFAEETDPFIPTTSASSTVSSGVNIAQKRHLRNEPAYGSTGRQRFCTPPQTPHFAAGAITREEQMAFLTPPPSYEQVGVHQQHLLQQQHLQQQQQQHHHHMMPSAPQSMPHYVTDQDMMMRATQATKF